MSTASLKAEASLTVPLGTTGPLPNWPARARHGCAYTRRTANYDHSMPPLSIDMTRPVRSRADQQALVRAVLEASPDEQETNWLEWKGPLTLGAKDAAGRAAIAKAVLGFANRDPAAASRAMGGCAYLLAGVSPGELSGVEAVDAAELEARVAIYVGPNVGWRADYVAVDDRSVLVVTVEPPQWGDPVHPVRKTFNSSERGGLALQSGMVFVRHQASTNRADDSDMDMLSRRAARRPGDQLEVAVGLTAETTLRAIDTSDDVIERYISQEQARLLAPLGRAQPSEIGALYESTLTRVPGLSSWDRDMRSEGDFRKEVGSYGQKLRDQLPDVLRARAVLHGVARLKLQVVNDTDTTFTRVQVEAKLPPHLWATDWQDAVADDAEPPTPPTPYGEARISRMGSYRGFGPAIRPLVPGSLTATPWRPDVRQRSGAIEVEYVPEDVRAKGVTPLPSVWLLLEDSDSDEVEVSWEATATNAEKRVSGTLRVPITRPPASIKDLLAELPDDD